MAHLTFKKGFFAVLGVVLVAGAVFGGLMLWKGSGQQASQTENENKEEEKPVQVQLSEMEQKIADMSLREKIAGVMMFHVSGTSAVKMKTFLDQYQPAGLIFMGDNIPADETTLATMTGALQDGASLPYLLAIDEEGGVVIRLKSDTFPSARQLKSQTTDATTAAFAERTNLLKQSGFNVNFGIVADMTNDANSFIYSRVFGGTPEAASERVAAAVAGTTEGTLATLKHFPGHGRPIGDSHIAVPVAGGMDKTTWREQDGAPFAAGIEAGAELLMFGHLEYSDIDRLPATLSPTWHQIARDDLGFKGIIVTDDMLMLTSDASYQDNLQNSIAALAAGCDLLLFVNDHGAGTIFDVDELIDGAVAAVDAGELTESRIDEALQRVLEARQSLISH